MDITQIAGAILLFLFMLMVGLDLTPADFRRVFDTPRAIVVGTLGQILLLPILAFSVTQALGVSPVFSAGAVVLAVSPGAGASNVMVAFARANIALSVTLTAVASVLAVLTLPPIASFAIGGLLADAAAVEVPVGELMVQLAFSLLLPITLGVSVRANRPDIADRYLKVLQRVIVVGLVVVAVLFVSQNEAVTSEIGEGLEGGTTAMLAAGVWTVTAMALGWGIARLLRLEAADRFTFLIEFSTRNITVATLVALSGLGRIDLTLFSAVYATVGYPIAALAVTLRRVRLARAARGA